MYSLAREFRWFLWLAIGFSVPAGLILFFNPNGTESFWAWAIHERRSATLIAAGYLGAIPYFYFVLKQNDWRNYENGAGALILFSFFSAIATAIHFDHLRGFSLPSLVWIGTCLAAILIPILYRLQLNLTRSRMNLVDVSQISGRRISRGWIVWLVVRGLFYLILSVAWFISSTEVTTLWPWPIEQFDLRIFTAQMVLVGWISFMAIRDDQEWNRHKLGLLLTASLGLVQIIGLSITSAQFDGGNSVGIFLIVLFIEWIATPAMIWFKREREGVAQLAS